MATPGHLDDGLMRALGSGLETVADPLAAYDYRLPAELIAQEPLRRRVMARLLVLDRRSGALDHQGMWRLPRLLRSGDLLVLNDTEVVPARLWARKASGGRVEVLLLAPGNPVRLRPDGGQEHQVLLRSHRPLHPGQELWLDGGDGGDRGDGGDGGDSGDGDEGEAPLSSDTRLRLLQKGERGKWLISLPAPALQLARRLGQVPLPPYIKRPQGPRPADRRRYQTVYAAEPGAVAAPTAGLHFSPALLGALQRRGVGVAKLTLHVGYGTFAEPAAADLAAGRLHPEWVRVPPEVSHAVAETKRRGGRVIAVGTTSMRALEWRAAAGRGVEPGEGWCDLLIQEGHRFRAADGMITNFHLPRTTLLMLVAALAGRDSVLRAYGEAVKRRYRFYSYGDAMLII